MKRTIAQRWRRFVIGNLADKMGCRNFCMLGPNYGRFGFLRRAVRHYIRQTGGNPR